MSWLPGMEPYGVVVADCPWSYENERTGGGMESAAAQQYPTMTVEQLVDFGLQVERWILPDCLLFLWATSPLLPDALRVVGAWGFAYRAAIYWEKTGRLGMGWWVRNNVEVCLVAARGEVGPTRLGRNVIRAPAREHSRKPEEFWSLIEPCLAGRGRLLEVFAREARPGWDRFGLDAPAGEGRVDP